MKIKNKNLGIIYIIMSAFFFAFMGTFVKLAGDLPTMQKAFFRNAVALVFALVLILKDRSNFSIKKGDWKYLVLRAGFGTAGLICNFYALDKLVLSDALMLNKMSPFFAVIASYFILKEKIKPIQALTVILAFIGALFIIKPTFVNMNLVPSLLGFLGGLGAGVAYTYVRVLGQRGVKGPFVVFFFSVFSCVATLPFVILNYHPMTFNQIVFLLCAGLSASFGQFSITAAYMHAPAREISIFDYTQVIFTTIISLFIFNELPDGLSIVGYIIIILVAVYVFLYNQRIDRLKKE